MAQKISQKDSFMYGKMLFGASLIIQGLTGMMEFDDQAEKGYFKSFLSVLYICAGGLVVAEMKAGPLVSAITIVIYALVYANPMYINPEARST